MNAPTTPETVAPANNMDIALDLLTPSPTNPRQHFDDDYINELSISIKACGVLQPLLVREIRNPTGKPANQAAAKWPFPEPAKYSQAEKLYAQRISAKVAPMPKDGDAALTPGLKAALFEIEENKKTLPSGRFEIIAGECRYRAAKLAGVTHVPVLMRNLTDLQVLHAQIIENLQRKGLHPLEEAEGYKRLIELGSKAEDLGKEVGKSRNYIYGRLKLLDLGEPARKAFFSGELDSSTAVLIARIPVHKIQSEVIDDISKGEMSFREARDHIQRHYMLDLNRAPFDRKDAELLPKAGNCTACPKRTGNQKDLFADIKNQDICTDPVCFGMKKTANVLLLQAQAAARGDKVIKSKEAKKLIPQHYVDTRHQLKQSGLDTLDGSIPNDPKGRTWGDALKLKKLDQPGKDGGVAVHKTIIEDPHNSGEILQAINIEEATKALRQAGFDITLKGTASPEAKADKQRREKQKASVSPENIWREKLFDELRASIKADLDKGMMKQALFGVLAWNAFDSHHYDNETVKGLIARHTPDLASLTNHDARVDAFRKKLPELSPMQHFLIVFELEMERERTVDIWGIKRESKPDTMLQLATVQGIDAEALRLSLMEKPSAPAKKPAAKSVAKPASTPTKAAPAAKKSAPKPKAAQAAKASA